MSKTRRGSRYYVNKLRRQLKEEYDIETEVESIEGEKGWHRFYLIDFHAPGNHRVFDFSGSMAVSGALEEAVLFFLKRERG